MTHTQSPSSAAAQIFPSPQDIRARGLNSLPILRIDYVTENPPVCSCCNRPLPTGSAFVLAYDEMEIYAGPDCVKKYGYKPHDIPIPNLTRGSHHFYDTRHHPIRANLADPSVMGTEPPEDWRALEAAMSYALLRERMMPKLGVTGTSFRLTKNLYEGIKLGQKNPPQELILPVLRLMKSQNIPRRLTFESLQAQYAHLAWGQRVLALGRLQPTQAYTLQNILEELKKTGLLTEPQHSFIGKMVSKYFPKAPRLKLDPVLRRQPRTQHNFTR